MMMFSDRHEDGARDGAHSESSTQRSMQCLRSLEEHRVDITGSESNAELALMQSAVDAFRRAAETLAGRAPLGAPTDDLYREVVPPRAADETPRQYAERVTRMTERFHVLSQSSSRERPR